MCQLGATIAYFAVITVGFTDPRHSLAFGMTFDAEFGDFTLRVPVPCGANSSIQVCMGVRVWLTRGRVSTRHACVGVSL